MLETNTESLDSWTIQETRKEPSTGKGNKGLEGWGREQDMGDEKQKRELADREVRAWENGKIW